MAHEDQIQQQLLARFPVLADRIVLRRARRLFAEVPAEQFHDIITFARNDLQFVHLCTIVGFDEGENLAFLYQLAREDGTMLMLRYLAPKANPVIRSIGYLFPGGLLYERELVDLLGTQVEGLPPGKRYPLPDDWPAGQYPLRKDWSPEMLDKLPKPVAEGVSHA
jgi:Ni,Fe-hydrogenase III component G